MTARSPVRAGIRGPCPPRRPPGAAPAPPRARLDGAHRAAAGWQHGARRVDPPEEEADDGIRPGGQERDGDRRIGPAPLPRRRRRAPWTDRHHRPDPGARRARSSTPRAMSWRLASSTVTRTWTRRSSGTRSGTSSCYHGITTAVMGNCGFTLAPCAAADKQLVIRNLQRAEDLSPEAMEAGIKWQWTTFPSFSTAWRRCPRASTTPATSVTPRCAHT